MELIKLVYHPDKPPLAVIIAAQIAGVSISVNSDSSVSLPVLLLPNSEELHGASDILRYIGRVSTAKNIYSRDDAVESDRINKWIDYASNFASVSELKKACSHVDGNLSQRTFLVGSSLSIADISIWSALAGTGKRWQSLCNSKKYQNLVRWFNSIRTECHAIIMSDMTARFGMQTISKSSKEKQQGAQDSKTSDLCLPDAEIGKVVVRFAPEPSGYMHIGHAKAALLNQYFKHKYHGKLILRFDDTNPDKENSEFVDNLKMDIDILGISYDRVTHSSDYFPEMMKMAENLIIEGKAYVDDTLKDTMKAERRVGKDSKCRNNSIEENLKLWKEMIDESERDSEDPVYKRCLRGKLNMQDPNKAMRDPVYYRSNSTTPHHRTNSKYKFYPTYEFACPFVDAKEGITHALRASEYHDRNDQYHWVQKDMGFEKVHLYEFSRLNLVYTPLSKRNLLKLVQNGDVEGWDDPRFPTIQGIIRRGLKIDALKEFIIGQGGSKNLNLMEWDKIWSINKKKIDPVCPRHTAVIEKRRVLLTLDNGPVEPYVRNIPKHKKNNDLGDKDTTFSNRIWIDQDDAQAISVDEEVTLMDWGNAIIKGVEKDEEGYVTRLNGDLHPEGSVKTTKLKLTWLAESDELVTLSLVDFDYLIIEKKIEKDGKFLSKKEKDEKFMKIVNPHTKRETAALGDSNMRGLNRGDIVQLERKGYFRCDVPFPSKPVVLFAIPDGKQQPVMRFHKKV